jgi:hypothetical protein
MGQERCPQCADSLRIVRVKFKWSGTRLLYSCPNCVQVQDSVPKAEPSSEGKSERQAPALAHNVRLT